ncbi:MAG: glycosyltransferase, partial [Nitrococcus mobilis]|nr:glycosyltransferase [Nitrococcus mobilis]
MQPALPMYRVPVFRCLAREAGVELFVVYGTEPSIPNAEAVGFSAGCEPQRLIGLGPKLPFVWQSAQLRYADRRHADVLILSSNSWSLSLPLALLLARRRGVRTIVWGHGYSKNAARWRGAIGQRVRLIADAMLLYSRTVAERYVASGVNAMRVYVAANCLDQQPIQAARRQFLEDPAQLNEFCREQGFHPQVESILYVSRFEVANRVDLLLKAAALLAPKRPWLRV